MGHRRSHTHSRASRRGSPEIVPTYSKGKHDINKDDSKAYDRSSREKRERKRKREHEDSSKKKHKEKRKGKNGHHKTKEKSKDKASRRRDCRILDNTTPESDSSISFLSSRGAHRSRHSRDHCSQSHSRSCSRNTDSPRECSHSGNADVLSRIKKCKGNIEDDIRQIHEAPNDAMQVENGGFRRSQLMQVKDLADGLELKRYRRDIEEDGCDVTRLRHEEQDKCSDGKNNKVLEVELRQRALANFLRHQDVSCKIDEHKERISPATNLDAAGPSSRDEGAVTDMDSVRSSAYFNNPQDVCEKHKTAQNHSSNLRSNLEEGEIISDNENETGNENAFLLVDERKVLNNKENHGTIDEASRETQKEQTESRLSNAAEVERLARGVDVAAAHSNDKQELLQKKAVEGSPKVDTAACMHDVDTSFQQKTMSVMRGGEMVQVSYKVYIPKRAAELARRRLQR